MNANSKESTKDKVFYTNEVKGGNFSRDGRGKVIRLVGR